MHIWDGVTPVEEIVHTLGSLVTAGKIRYFALSDMPAWMAMKAATIATERRIPGPIAIQVEYSLVARDVEAEHLPAARDAGMGVMPWSPLAGGFLAGKYRRGDIGTEGRLSGPNPFGTTKFTDRNWAILDVLREVAAEWARPPAEIALAWAMARPASPRPSSGPAACPSSRATSPRRDRTHRRPDEPPRRGERPAAGFSAA